MEAVLVAVVMSITGHGRVAELVAGQVLLATEEFKADCQLGRDRPGSEVYTSGVNGAMATERPVGNVERPLPATRRGGRAHRQRGAEALAAALVMMMLLPVMFLLVDIAWGIFLKATLQHAVREGVRFAITSETSPAPGGGNLGHEASIKGRTITAAGGILTGQEDKVSVSFFAPDLTLDTSGSRNRGGNIVMVNIENFEYRPLIPVNRIGNLQTMEIRQDPAIRITVHAADRMESCPLGTCAPL